MSRSVEALGAIGMPMQGSGKMVES